MWITVCASICTTMWITACTTACTTTCTEKGIGQQAHSHSGLWETASSPRGETGEIGEIGEIRETGKEEGAVERGVGLEESLITGKVGLMYSGKSRESRESG